MTHFLKFALLRPLQAGGGRWQLEEPLVYSADDDKIYIVPKGFRTDLASIPKLLWAIWPPFGRYTSAAVLHDYLCENAEVSRYKGDCLFLEAMGWSNVPKFKRWTIFFAVRVFAIIMRIK